MRMLALAQLAGGLGLLAGLVVPREAAADDLAKDRPAGQIEAVVTFEGAMPTGVTVSRAGRIFVCYPKWGDKVDFTVGEVKQGHAVAYPDESINRAERGQAADRLISVQSVVVDPIDRLWIVDTGSIEFGPDVARRAEARGDRPGDQSGGQDDRFPAERGLLHELFE